MTIVEPAASSRPPTTRPTRRARSPTQSTATHRRTSAPVDEIALIEAARTRDENAVFSLIERCDRHIVAAIASAGIWPGDARFDDARNQTLLAIWQQFPNFRGEAAPSTWMYQIARHTSISGVIHPEAREQRRQQRLDAFTSPSANQAATHEADVIDNHMLPLIWEELTTADREILSLRVIQEMSVADIGQQLFLSPSGVKLRIHRAKKQLQAAARRLGMLDT